MVLIKEGLKDELYFTNIIDDSLEGYYLSNSRFSNETQFKGHISDGNKYVGKWIWKYKNVYFM